MYVMRFKGTSGRALYYVKDEWYQDGPDSSGQKIFRTIFLADAMMFSDRQEVEECIKELDFIPERVKIEFITDAEFEAAKREKFKAILSGDYIGSKG